MKVEQLGMSDVYELTYVRARGDIGLIFTATDGDPGDIDWDFSWVESLTKRQRNNPAGRYNRAWGAVSRHLA